MGETIYELGRMLWPAGALVVLGSWVVIVLVGVRH